MINESIREWLKRNSTDLFRRSSLALDHDARLVAVALTYIMGALHRNRLDALLRHIAAWVDAENKEAR